ARMIMHIVVDSVAPRAAPTVRFEQLLKHGRRIGRIDQVDRAAIADKRQRRIVWDPAIVLEAAEPGLAWPDPRRGVAARRPRHAGETFEGPLQGFLGVEHRRSSPVFCGSRAHTTHPAPRKFRSLGVPTIEARLPTTRPANREAPPN